MYDWDSIPLQNEVAKSFHQAQEFVNAVEGGELPVVWLAGPGGVGKTHAMKQAIARWKLRDLEPVYSNPSNYNDVVKAFKTAKGKRPIIMDEADVIFRSDKCLNLLKIATDTKGTGYYEGVNVRAPLIATTNAPLGDTAKFKAELRPHISALLNRVPPVTISFDRFAGWEYACSVAMNTTLTAHTTKGRAISAKTLVKALRWFTDNMNDIELLSARTLYNVCEWMTIYSDTTVEKTLAEQIGGVKGRRAAIPLIDWDYEVSRRIRKAATERETGLAHRWESIK